MVRQLVFVLLMCSVFALSAFAGTWVDDFNDGNLDSWTPGNIFGTGEWTVQDGKLSGWNKGGTSAIWMEPSEWKDYTLEASVYLLEKLGSGDMEMSLTVRTDPQSLSLYGFCLQFAGGKYPSDQIQINRFRGVANIDHWVRKNHEILEKTWYRLKGSIVGNHLSFYIDDGLLAEFNAVPPILEAGTVGIYVCDVHMLFDDIVITGFDIPDGGSIQTANSDSSDRLAITWGKAKSH